MGMAQICKPSEYGQNWKLVMKTRAFHIILCVVLYFLPAHAFSKNHLLATDAINEIKHGIEKSIIESIRNYEKTFGAYYKKCVIENRRCSREAFDKWFLDRLYQELLKYERVTDKISKTPEAYSEKEVQVAEKVNQVLSKIKTQIIGLRSEHSKIIKNLERIDDFLSRSLIPLLDYAQQTNSSLNKTIEYFQFMLQKLDDMLRVSTDTNAKVTDIDKKIEEIIRMLDERLPPKDIVKVEIPSPEPDEKTSRTLSIGLDASFFEFLPDVWNERYNNLPYAIRSTSPIFALGFSFSYKFHRVIGIEGTFRIVNSQENAKSISNDQSNYKIMINGYNLGLRGFLEKQINGTPVSMVLASGINWQEYEVDIRKNELLEKSSEQKRFYDFVIVPGIRANLSGHFVLSAQFEAYPSTIEKWIKGYSVNFGLKYVR